jgi:predicted dehydrogenase
MEVSVEDCEAILAAQKKSGAKLMIAFRLHHEPGTLDVIDRVRKGDFGDPRIFSSVFTQDLKPENHRAKQGNALITHSSMINNNDLILRF